MALSPAGLRHLRMQNLAKRFPSLNSTQQSERVASSASTIRTSSSGTASNPTSGTANNASTLDSAQQSNSADLWDSPYIRSTDEAASTTASTTATTTASTTATNTAPTTATNTAPVTSTQPLTSADLSDLWDLPYRRSMDEAISEEEEEPTQEEVDRYLHRLNHPYYFSREEEPQLLQENMARWRSYGQPQYYRLPVEVGRYYEHNQSSTQSSILL